MRRHSSTGAPTIGPRSITPGVVDEGVQASELGDGSLDHGLGLLLVGHVGLEDENTLPVLGAEPVGQRLQPVAPSGGHGHRRPLGGQGHGGGLTDPARSPGHQGDGAVQTAAAHRRRRRPDRQPRRVGGGPRVLPEVGPRAQHRASVTSAEGTVDREVYR